jgi:hypothetical protein
MLGYLVNKLSFAKLILVFGILCGGQNGHGLVALPHYAFELQVCFGNSLPKTRMQRLPNISTRFVLFSPFFINIV